MDSENQVICWFSAGATSAVSAKLAVKKYPHVRVIYCDTGGEHFSNKQFVKDVEKWIAAPVEIIKNDKFTDHFDVFNKRRFIVGIHGAPCTIELKKKIRERIQEVDGIQIFGFSVEEKKRASDFQTNQFELNLEFNLIEANLSKGDCLAMLQNAGIKLPFMYQKQKSGVPYDHNNCIGCPKGQQGYWNKIRIDFPDVFERMAKLERKLDAAVNKKYINGVRHRLFLDELNPKAGNFKKETKIECSMFCHIAEKE